MSQMGGDGFNHLATQLNEEEHTTKKLYEHPQNPKKTHVELLLAAGPPRGVVVDDVLFSWAFESIAAVRRCRLNTSG